MCGITGYIGAKDGVNVVLEGLKTLESRGYDSWGIAAKNHNKLTHMKKIGKISNVQLDELKIEASGLCIGHTRWVTHGTVTEANAHPQFSSDKRIAVVHNGIVENYQGLRKELEKKGYSFASNTDTEIIPQQIQLLMDNGMNFPDAVKATLRMLEGSFAVVAMHSDYDILIGGRRGSPLVLGVSESRDKAAEYFIASDVPAFLNHTNNVVYLNDNEIAVLGKDMKVFDLETDKEVSTFIKQVDWSPEQAKKGKFEHYMLKEIFEQKTTIRRAIKQDRDKMERIIKMLSNAKGVFFVGCGTSHHACVSASYIFSHIAKMHVNVVIGSEFCNYKEFLTEDTLMIAVSQSGETADLLDAVNIAKAKGVKIISVVNVMGSTLMRISDENIMMNAGPEICVLSTKTYTSELAILLSLAYGCAGKLDRAKSLIADLSSRVPQIIEKNVDNLKELASRLKQCRDLFLIGRDLAYPSALEGALKIKEVSYIHAEGFAGGELKHGTLALIEEKTPVIVLTTQSTKSLILSNAMEIRARGGYMIGIDSEDNELYDHFIEIEDFDYASPIAMIIPIQILSYYLALERKCDPDKPRNLAKSITVK